MDTVMCQNYERSCERRCIVCRYLNVMVNGTLPLNIESMRAFAVRGCESCTLLATLIDQIWKQCDQDYVSARFELSRDDVSELFLCTRPSRLDNEIDEVFEIFTSKGRQSRLRTIPRRTLLSGIMTLTCATSQISRWLTDCLIACHGDMRSELNFCQHADRSAQPLPTRIILIKGPRDICLYNVDPQKSELARYACLSYCWGQHKFIHTDKSNINDFGSRIPWDCLPLTFQDAVEITWRLGISFLWIDSFCIVQDDKDDWRHESSRMASIYSQAYITLAATVATGPSDGLILRQPNRQGRGTLRPQKISQAECDIYIVSVPPKIMQTPEDWPLLGRAWVFQERYLSPRVVHFTGKELMWECRSLGTCECWPADAVKESPRIIHHWDHPLTRAWTNSPRDPGFATMANWHRIVEVYSTLSLTYRDDIFPVLQGIARLMEEQRQTRYFAGLWEDTFLYDMLWRGTSKEQRVDTGRAPSWSWASYLGPVRFYMVDDGALYTAASVVLVATEPIGTDPLGAISSGTLQLKGRCIEMNRARQSLYLDLEYRKPIIVMGLFHPRPGSSAISSRSYCIALELIDDESGLYRRIQLMEQFAHFLKYGCEDIHELLKNEGTVRTLTIV